MAYNMLETALPLSYPMAYHCLPLAYQFQRLPLAWATPWHTKAKGMPPWPTPWHTTF